MKVIELAKEYLSNEGYRFDIDKDGDIHFKYQGLHVYVSDPEGDTNYFRMFVPHIYEIQSDRIKTLEVVNKLTASYKVLKAFVANNLVHLSIEIFIDSTPEFDDFVPRCLDILFAAYKEFAQEMAKPAVQ